MHNNIYKRSKLFAFILFIQTSCFFFLSCSNETDGTINQSYTPEQKLEIRELERKYNIDEKRLTLLDGNGKLSSMEEIEEFFQQIYYITHQQQVMIPGKNGTFVSVRKSGKMKVVTGTEVYNGTFSGRDSGSLGWLEIGVSWTNLNATGGTITVSSSFTSDNPAYSYSQTSSTSSYSGVALINFTTKGNLTNGKGSYTINGSGHVDLNSNSGVVDYN